MKQIVCVGGFLDNISDVLKQIAVRKLFLVCGNSFDRAINREWKFDSNIKITRFSNFNSNPDCSSIKEAISLFKDSGCDGLLAVGGGSAIDVAKCVKFNLESDELPFIAVPTTAGSGSEATRFAVYYKDGQKQSVSNSCIIPNFVILDYRFLNSLPNYQKKCTLMDAFCQAIESYWSVNSTVESKSYASKSLNVFTRLWKDYIYNPSAEILEEVMEASYNSGKAINITQTTAVHAMSYKLTSIYHLPHGHAVSLCMPLVWNYMIENTEKCCDDRGSEYLVKTFKEIAGLLGCETPHKAVNFIENIIGDFGLAKPFSQNRSLELKELSKSVNQERLRNNPVLMTENVLYGLYEKIIK